MSEIKAGDVRVISCDNTEIGSFLMEHKATEDATIQPGGFKVDDDENSVTTAGTDISKFNRYKWSFESTVGALDGCLSYLQKMAEAGVPSQFTFEMSNGNQWVGTGRINGDIAENAQAGTIAVKFSGGGRLKQI